MIKIIGFCCVVFLIILALFKFFDSYLYIEKDELVKEFVEEIEREDLNTKGNTENGNSRRS